MTYFSNEPSLYFGLNEACGALLGNGNEIT